MRLAIALFAICAIAGCASPKGARDPEPGFGSGIACNAQGGFVNAWHLTTVADDLTEVHAELTFESPHPDDEKWRPVVWLMLDDGREANALRIDLWQPEGSDALELTARLLRNREFSAQRELESGIAVGDTRAVSVDWSHPDQVEIRVGGTPVASGPIDFPVERILAGCSSASARVWVPASD